MLRGHMVISGRPYGMAVRNSTKTEKGLVLVLGTVLSQRRLSTMRGVEL